MSGKAHEERRRRQREHDFDIAPEYRRAMIAAERERQRQHKQRPPAIYDKTRRCGKRRKAVA